MLFLMRDGIQPIWEDEKNRNGGCFSYKINNYVCFNLDTEYYHKSDNNLNINININYFFSHKFNIIN